MLALNEKAMKQPIGGHHYACHGIMFRGDSFTEVVEKLANFRINNGIPIGNPDQEILMTYAASYPNLVKTRIGDAEKPSEEYRKWRLWVNSVWKDPPSKQISERQAKERWKKCIGCKYLTDYPWKKTDESAQIQRRAFLLRKGAACPEKIQFCSLHLADIPVLSFIETPAKYTDAPKDKVDESGCWVNNLNGCQKQ